MRSKHVIGVDEVGTGAWAGPMVVTAVLAPLSWNTPGLKDSKKFSNKKELTAVADRILSDREVHTTTVFVPPAVVDSEGFMPSLVQAFAKVITDCVSLLLPKYDAVTIIVDGVLKLPVAMPYHCVPKADAKYKHVAAASIVAKSTRDQYMKKMGTVYPGYGFEQHVGYGTEKHRAALVRHGPCPLHRMSISPLQELLDRANVQVGNRMREAL